jgi:hypothetical protein
MIFLTGANSDYEDVLEWFIEHYHRHNKLPLHIVDFGLKKSYPNSFKVKWKQNPWFYKPRAIFEAPSDKVCWLDCDIEVRADMSDVFELTGNNDIGLTKDFCRKDCEWATGLVCSTHKSKLHDWMYLSETRVKRGDQEAFAFVQNKYKIAHIPDEYQWLRLAGDRPDVKAMHWTGAKGKEHIRQMINTKKKV